MKHKQIRRKSGNATITLLFFFPVEKEDFDEDLYVILANHRDARCRILALHPILGPA